MARVLISLPDDLLKELDDYTKKEHYNRSEFLRYFLRGFLNKEKQKTNTAAGEK
jgi:metal-responsive CopG/Arc/MetJ family transcriptional regulator